MYKKIIKFVQVNVDDNIDNMTKLVLKNNQRIVRVISDSPFLLYI